MTPDEFREIIEKLGLSQIAAARLLGVDARTSRRWASGERDIPPPAVRFLRYLIATKKTGEQAMRVLDEQVNHASQTVLGRLVVATDLAAGMKMAPFSVWLVTEGEGTEASPLIQGGVCKVFWESIGDDEPDDPELASLRVISMEHEIRCLRVLVSGKEMTFTIMGDTEPSGSFSSAFRTVENFDGCGMTFAIG